VFVKEVRFVRLTLVKEVRFVRLSPSQRGKICEIDP
jgi:hypothetical protein